MPGPALAQTNIFQKGLQALDIFQQDKSEQQLSNAEVASGLKEALRVGTSRVVNQLGQKNGFFDDPDVHIPLPENFQKVRSMLEVAGMKKTLDNLELKLNRAAEIATPKAKELFWESIRTMTWEDVTSIYNGPDDAATRYFQEKMSGPLAKAMEPVVNESLAKVGAIETYNRFMGKYTQLPFVPDLHSDLNSYVVTKGMDGIFLYLARQEAAIRNNPAERTTELLKRVFNRE
jgi:hypothetical protein